MQLLTVSHPEIPNGQKSRETGKPGGSLTQASTIVRLPDPQNGLEFRLPKAWACERRESSFIHANLPCEESAFHRDGPHVSSKTIRKGFCIFVSALPSESGFYLSTLGLFGQGLSSLIVDCILSGPHSTYLVSAFSLVAWSSKACRYEQHAKHTSPVRRRSP